MLQWRWVICHLMSNTLTTQQWFFFLFHINVRRPGSYFWLWIHAELDISHYFCVFIIPVHYYVPLLFSLTFSATLMFPVWTPSIVSNCTVNRWHGMGRALTSTLCMVWESCRRDLPGVLIIFDHLLLNCNSFTSKIFYIPSTSSNFYPDKRYIFLCFMNIYSVSVKI